MAMTAINLPDEMGERVKTLAKTRQRTAHWIMREAVSQYVEREEAIEKLKEDAYRSWAAYQETGRHLTWDETRAWLRTWGSERASEMPGCHE